MFRYGLLADNFFHFTAKTRQETTKHLVYSRSLLRLAEATADHFARGYKRWSWQTDNKSTYTRPWK